MIKNSYFDYFDVFGPSWDAVVVWELLCELKHPLGTPCLRSRKWSFYLGNCCGQEATLWSANPLLSPKKRNRTYLWPFNENRVVGYQGNSCQVSHQSRKWSFLHYFWHVLVKLGHLYGLGVTLWSGHPLLAPARAESEVFCFILEFVGQFRPLLWPGGLFVVREPRLEP